MYYYLSVKKKNTTSSFEKINFFVGRISSYLVLLLIILISVSVALRYIFSIGFTWLQDLYIWIHALIILLGISYTFNKDGHVRIDILYRNFDEPLKKKINLLGSLFFGIPLCYFLIFKGYNYFIRSFLIDENSKEAGGLPNLFILKFFIFSMGLLLFIEIVNKIRKFISKHD